MIRRRHLLATAAACIAARSGIADKPSTLLVGGKPGSAVDGLARGFLPFLSKHLTATLVVANVGGEAGLAALQQLARAPADDTTLGWVTTPTLPARIVDRGVDDLMGRIVLLGAIEKEPIAIVSPAATPLGSVQDIIARSAEDADAVPLATPPPGSPPHLAALRLQSVVATRLNIVSFPSAAAALKAATDGDVAAAALGLTTAIADLRASRLVGLGIAAANRADAFPDMPPLRDSGIDLSAIIRRGLAAPADLSRDVAARLCEMLQAVVDEPEFRDYADTTGVIPSWLDGAAWTERTNKERAALAQIWETEPWLQDETG